MKAFWALGLFMTLATCHIISFVYADHQKYDILQKFRTYVICATIVQIILYVVFFDLLMKVYNTTDIVLHSVFGFVYLFKVITSYRSFRQLAQQHEQRDIPIHQLRVLQQDIIPAGS